MRFENVKRVLASSVVLAGAGCGSVDGVAPPVNATSSGSVDEGGTLAMKGTLVTADPDSDADQLVYTVESLPAHGALMHNGAALEVGGSFSQKDVNDGKVTYVNDGNENTADEFTWTLSDGPNTIPATSFAITITAVNDAPLIVNNQEGTIPEGGNAIITAEQMSVTDAETPTPLTFTVVEVKHGTLQQKVGGVEPFVAIAAGATFTPQDVVDGNLKFIDSGVDDANLAAGNATQAGFSWTVADADGGVTEGMTKFSVTPVDDAPAISWKASTCYKPNIANAANPIMAFADPDTPTSAYQICIASIYNGSQVVCPTGSTTQCVTNSVAPTVKNGATVLTISSCLAANALPG